MNMDHKRRDSIAMFKVLHRVPLIIFWAGQFLSTVGDQLHEVAVVILAVKLIGSNAGLILSFGVTAKIVFGLLGGVTADHWQRQKIMITIDLLRAASVLILPVAHWLGGIQAWQIMLVSVLLGSLKALFEPALHASLPELAEDTRTLQALNGLMDINQRLARIFGPGLIGILIARTPIANFFTLNSLSFLISALTLYQLWLRLFHPSKRKISPPSHATFIQEIRLAFRVVGKHKALIWSLCALVLVALFWNAAVSVGLVMLAENHFPKIAGAYGWLLAAYGVGNVLSNLIVGNISIRRRAYVFFLGKIVLGCGMFLLAISKSFLSSLLSACLAAFGGPMGDITLMMTIQREFPDHQIGKVSSLRMILTSLGASLGLMIATPMFSIFGPSIGLALCGFAIILVGFIGSIRFRRTKS